MLCDGTVVACEQDALARKPIGDAGTDSLEAIWTQHLAGLRQDHDCGRWDRHALCAACTEWHRP
ncbi:MAG: SPASM domain-containing protein [Tepidisphaeraceae bacterium]